MAERPARFDPLRIAVLVQSDPRQDSRVRKEVETLGRAGHLVDVFGPMAAESASEDRFLGARNVVPVTYRPQGKGERIYQAIDRRRSALSAYLLIVVFALIVAAIGGVMRTLGWNQFTVTGLIATGIVAGIGVYVGRGRALIDSVIGRLRARLTSARRGRYYQGVAHQLAAAVPTRDYDALHCHDLIPLMAGAKLKARAPHLRLVWDAHEFYEASAGASASDERLFHGIVKAAAPHVDRLVTINLSIARLYAEHHPKLPTALIVMNATRESDRCAYDGRLHRAAGLTPERKILLFQGGLHPYRGIEILLEAARDLPAPWAIVFMGDGPLARVIAARLPQSGTGPKTLVLLPSVPNTTLRAWTSGASLGIIPYENKGFNHLYCTPNKLWEYPCAGVPILASDLVEMGQMIRDHGTGFLLPRDFTSADIVNALCEITPQALETARAKCRVFGRTMSWANFEPDLLKAYSHEPKHTLAA